MKKAMAFVATAKARESRRFYEEVLGLRFLEEHEFAIVFDAYGTMLRIQKAGAVVVAPYTSFGLEIDDIEGEVDALRKRGIKGKRYEHFDQDARGIWTSPDGARIFWFEDPDGNLISLTQFPG
jgi:catechol 2,3-dioxygenase-like lactoylglutathione lyase family enzyme